MKSSFRYPISLTLALCWAAVVGVTIYARPLMPVDETRYVSVAWEMWQRNDFLVPFLNGAPYSHKPPLFFWLMHTSWWVFGVNELTPRLIAPLFGLLNLVLVGVVARRLWPESRPSVVNSSLILMSFLGWALFTTTTMFDMLLTFFVLLGVLGVLQVRDGCPVKGWFLLGLSIGCGILAKGPITLLYLLPLLLLAPFWSRGSSLRWRKWVAGSLLATVLGAVIALSWALPAASAGGEAYAQAILWSQTAGRVSKAFAHQRPFWWYLPILPLLLFPWILFGSVWSGFKKQLADSGSRFCFCWIVPQLLILSLVSGKQVHYLLPILPAFALLFARSLDLMSEERPHPGWKNLAVGMFFLLGVVLLALPVFSTRLGLPAFNMEQGAVLFWPVLYLAVVGWLMVWKPKSWDSLIRNLCALTTLLVVAVLLVVFSQIRTHYDFSPMAKKIAGFQDQGIKIAHMGKYHNQFHFLGRLKRPLSVVKGLGALKTWSSDNPGGLVVYYQDKRQFPEEQALFTQSYRVQNQMGILKAEDLVVLMENKELTHP